MPWLKPFDLRTKLMRKCVGIVSVNINAVVIVVVARPGVNVVYFEINNQKIRFDDEPIKLKTVLLLITGHFTSNDKVCDYDYYLINPRGNPHEFPNYREKKSEKYFN